MIYDRNSAIKIYDRMIKYFILYVNKLIGRRPSDIDEENTSESMLQLKLYRKKMLSP